MKDYLSAEVPWDKTVNNIITMQACRHAIAHAGEVVDNKLLHQLSKPSDRDIQKNLKAGQIIQFTPDEIKLGGEAMVKYITNLTRKVVA